MRFVEILEDCLKAEGMITEPAQKEFLPMQPGGRLSDLCGCQWVGEGFWISIGDEAGGWAEGVCEVV